MTDPHPAALTPEQMAELVIKDCGLSLRDWEAQKLEGDIAAAIRSAVMAERKAERERCAEAADGMAEAAKVEFGPTSGMAVGAAAVAAYLRSTETDNG